MTKEEVYDSEISPLMAKIIEICKREKIAMIADFRLDPEEGLRCTTATLLDDHEPSDEQIEAFEILKPGAHVPPLIMTTITTTTKPNS